MSIGLSLAGSILSPLTASSALSGFSGLGLEGLLGLNFLGNLGSGAFSTAGDIFSSRMNYKYNKRLQEDAQAHQIYMFQNQNQWRVNDLRKAGLNPILATHAGSAMPSAGMNSVSMPSLGSNFKFDSLMDFIAKNEGYRSAKQKYAFNEALHLLNLQKLSSEIGVNSALGAKYLQDAERQSLENTFYGKPNVQELRVKKMRYDISGRIPRDLGFLDDVFIPEVVPQNRTSAMPSSNSSFWNSFIKGSKKNYKDTYNYFKRSFKF